jgi:hypothetical protein
MSGRRSYRKICAAVEMLEHAAMYLQVQIADGMNPVAAQANFDGQKLLLDHALRTMVSARWALRMGRLIP